MIDISVSSVVLSCDNGLWTNHISSAFSWAMARFFGEWCTLSFHIQLQAICLSQTLHWIQLQFL